MLEMLLSCALLTLLTGVLALAWTRGARGWTYSSKLSARMSRMAVLRHRVEKELNGSNALSLEAQGTSLSFASAVGLRNSAESGEYFRLPGRAEPRWRKYILYYWVSAEQCLYNRELGIPAGSPAETAPVRLTQVDLGSGPRALPFYCTGGEPVAKDVSDFSVQVDTNLVRLEFTCSEAIHGSTVRSFRVCSTTEVRN